MEGADKLHAANGKHQLPRSPSSVLQQLALEEADALEDLRLSDQGNEEPGRPAGEERGEAGRSSGCSKPNPAASEAEPAPSLPAPPRSLRRPQPAYAHGPGDRGAPAHGFGAPDWRPQQPVSPMYYMPQYEAYGPEAPLGSPGLVAHPYAWHYNAPFPMYPGAELGPSVASSPRSPVTGCVPPGSPCSPDYYCLQPMPFMPGLPGMGGQPMVMGPNGPLPAGMVLPYGGPPFSPTAGLPPRLAGGPPLQAGMRHGRVHRASDDLDKFRFDVAEAHSGEPSARTTVMIKNVPNKYSQKMLLEAFDRNFKGKYDFFYLPIDYKNKCNLGYCFMNFLGAELTAACYEEFHHKRWELFNSKKVAEVCYAKVQGCSGCVEHFKNAKFPCHDRDCLPLVFAGGQGAGEPLHAAPASPRQLAAA